MDAGGPIAWMAIAAGGALGALLRWSLLGLARRFDPALATLAANLAACGLLGVVTSGATVREADLGTLQPALSAFLTIGLCSSLSTFSTLCADTVRLLRSRSRLELVASLAAHLLGGPIALALGSRLGG